LSGHGYLPNVKPLQVLPTEFNQVNEILDKMTYWQPDGSATGLLAKNLLRKTIDSELANLTTEIKKVDTNDARLNAALFRDYSFLASAYMLESSHISHV
jgi:indoleamine 2,3-dioxygenase